MVEIGGDFPRGGVFPRRNGNKRSGSRAGGGGGHRNSTRGLSALLSCASKFNYLSGQIVHIALPPLENILLQDRESGSTDKFHTSSVSVARTGTRHTRPFYQPPPRVINRFTLGWLLLLTSNKVDNILGFERASPWLLKHNSSDTRVHVSQMALQPATQCQYSGASHERT